MLVHRLFGGVERRGDRVEWQVFSKPSDNHRVEWGQRYRKANLRWGQMTASCLVLSPCCIFAMLVWVLSWYSNYLWWNCSCSLRSVYLASLIMHLTLFFRYSTPPDALIWVSTNRSKANCSKSSKHMYQMYRMRQSASQLEINPLNIHSPNKNRHAYPGPAVKLNYQRMQTLVT